MKNELSPRTENLVSKGTLFITGGSNGIGQEILTRFTSKYPLTTNYDATEGRDVRDYVGLSDSMNSTLSNVNQNDLVLSAGVFMPVDFLKQSEEDIDFVLDTNLKGALYTVQTFLKCHEQCQNPIKPNIVIISSISSFFHGGKTNVIYDATKVAMSYMVKDLANFNCIVNAVEPGTIRQTQIGSWTPGFEKDEAGKKVVDKAQAKDFNISGIEVTKQDIADVVEMLLFNNPNGAINGTTITVDGGLTALKQRF